MTFRPRSENLCKQFGITKAVSDVTLEFQKGEIHGLIGENGSGKSTFCSILCGIYPVSSGRFLLEEKEHRVRSQVEANRCGVSIIVQEIGTLPGLTVAENIFFGEEDKFMRGIIKEYGRDEPRVAKAPGQLRLHAHRRFQDDR